MNYYKIIVYQKQNKTLYYKKIKSLASHYAVDQENGYGHKIVLVIDLLDLFHKRKKSIRNMALDKLISRLQKMKK